MLDGYRVYTIRYYILSFSPFLSLFKHTLFQISGRLFSDSGPRRSSRLSSDASLNANANTTVVSGNGAGNSYKGGSKLSPTAFRTMAVRKGQSWANENIDGGDDSSYISLLYRINFILHIEMP